MELCCFSFSSALALSFSSALQWGCCRGGSAGVGAKGLTLGLTLGSRLFARRPLGGRVALGRGRATPKATFFSHVSQSTHFGTIFSGPGPSEGCKCGQNRIGSFETKVSQFTVFCKFSPLWDVPGSLWALFW